VQLFSESTARALVCVSQRNADQFYQLCHQQGVPATQLGAVTDSDQLEIVGEFSVPLTELVQAHNTVPPAMR